MTPHLSTLRQRPGIFRLALLLLSVLALIFAIVDIILQSTDDFVAFEAIGPVFLSLTSVRSPFPSSTPAIPTNPIKVLLDARLVHQRHLRAALPRPIPGGRRRRTGLHRLGSRVGLWCDSPHLGGRDELYAQLWPRRCV